METTNQEIIDTIEEANRIIVDITKILNSLKLVDEDAYVTRFIHRGEIRNVRNNKLEAIRVRHFEYKQILELSMVTVNRDSNGKKIIDREGFYNVIKSTLADSKDLVSELEELLR